MYYREDGDQDGDVGELEGSNSSSGLLSHSSMGSRQLESPLPPQSSLDLDKQGYFGSHASQITAIVIIVIAIMS